MKKNMKIQKKFDESSPNQLVLVTDERLLTEYQQQNEREIKEKIFLPTWYNSPLFLFVIFIFLIMINLVSYIFFLQPTFFTNIDSQFNIEYEKSLKFIENSLSNSTEALTSVQDITNENAYSTCNIATFSDQGLENLKLINDSKNKFDISLKSDLKSNGFYDKNYNKYLEQLNKLMNVTISNISFANTKIDLTIQIDALKQVYNNICQNINLDSSYNSATDCNNLKTILNTTNTLKNKYTNLTIASIEENLNNRFSFCNTISTINPLNKINALEIFSKEFGYLNSLPSRGDFSVFFNIEDEFKIQLDELNASKNEYKENRENYKFYFLNI